MDLNEKLDLMQRAQKALAFGDGKLTVDAVELLILLESANPKMLSELQVEVESLKEALTAAEIETNETEDECSELRRQLSDGFEPKRVKLVEAIEILTALVAADA